MLNNYLKNDVAAVRQMERFEKARIEQVTSEVNEVKAQQRDPFTLPSLGVRDLVAEAAWFSKTAWWVPAGIAISIILYSISILGG